MRIKTNSAKRWKASYKWHDWYAWRPVILDNYIVWLETIYRKRNCSWYEISWDYKLKQKYEQK